MLSDDLRRMRQLAPCLKVQAAQRQAARVDAYRARSEQETADRALAESERHMRDLSASFSGRIGSSRTFSAQEAQCWRAVLATAIGDVDAAARSASEASRELEGMRQALSVEEAKARLLESALKSVQRRAARAREAIAIANSEHLRRPREFQP